MKHKIALCMVTLAMLLTATTRINLLRNSGFEYPGVTNLNTVRFRPGPPGEPDIMEWVAIDNIWVGKHWGAGYREGFPCPGDVDKVTGQPEAHVIDDPSRVYRRDQAQMMFTFWRCGDSWLWQRVSAKPGEQYKLTAHMHAWYSDCSHEPLKPPMDRKCRENIDEWADGWLMVGIDSLGWFDPTSSNVRWSPWTEIYGDYSDEPLSVVTTARASTITVFLRFVTTHPLKHENWYADRVRLVWVRRVFVPVMRR